MNKARIVMFVAILGVVLMTLAAGSASAASISVYVDGQLLVTDTPPVIVDGRTLVPLRAVFSALGADVDWNAATSTVVARKGGKTILLTVGQAQAQVGSEGVTLDVPARIVDGRTLVPLRFVAQSLGAQVDWNAAASRVTITTGASAAAAGYAGSEACFQCHPAQYNDFKVPGHGWKLKPASIARSQPLPLPAGYSWDDISYLIGGYKWKSRYMDKDGYIITSAGGQPGKNQFNLATGKWSDYDAGKVKKYDCGRCHTTGYSPEGNQGGLPGIVGTWAFPGVQCEACHGPAADHIAKGGDKTLVKVDKSSVLCGHCHVRGEAEQIPAKGGFIRHHEQYNELLASPHKALGCVTCHDPHKKAEYSLVKTCADCHSSKAAEFEGSAMQKVGVSCVDCHMPAATKSAVAFGRYKGDIKTHLFRINTDASASMFTEDGGLAKDFVTLGFACLSCHQGKDAEWAAQNAKGVHQAGK